MTNIEPYSVVWRQIWESLYLLTFIESLIWCMLKKEPCPFEISLFFFFLFGDIIAWALTMQQAGSFIPISFLSHWLLSCLGAFQLFAFLCCHKSSCYETYLLIFEWWISLLIMRFPFLSLWNKSHFFKLN